MPLRGISMIFNNLITFLSFCATLREKSKTFPPEFILKRRGDRRELSMLCETYRDKEKVGEKLIQNLLCMISSINSIDLMENQCVCAST